MKSRGAGSKKGPNCPACGRGPVTAFFESRGVPARVNFLCTTRRDATECPRGDIVLGFCETCGLVSNIAFDPAKLDYGASYENPLHHSEVFRAYAGGLADDLVEKFALRGKSIVELGCGDGYFLRELCERGRNRGIGFDPSYTGASEIGTCCAPVRIVPDYYSEKYASIDVDFLVCRHTLEHVRSPMDLLGPVRRSIGERANTRVFIEVPNASYTLDNCFVWDIIYEHVAYYTAAALDSCLRLAGFRVDRVYETYSGQFLCADAAPEDEREPSPDAHPEARAATKAKIECFVQMLPRLREEWNARIQELRESGGRVVVWGAGSKGITFLNGYDTRGVVECVVDVNPRKHGMFVAGTGHEIVGPDRLRELRPRAVLIANPVYRTEIEGALSSLGLAPECLTL